MKKHKKPPRLTINMLIMLLYLSLISVPAFAMTDETEAVRSSEATAEEAFKETEPEGAVPLTPDGNLSTIDDLKGEMTEDKQFITVKTKAGNTFYLIIDRAGDENNVYFLNLVDEADLMTLMEEDGTLENIPAEGAVHTSPEPTPEAVLKPEPEDDVPVPEKSMSLLPMVTGILILLGVTSLWFFKLRKPKQNVKGSTHLEEYAFDEDEDYDEDLVIEDLQDELEVERDEQ